MKKTKWIPLLLLVLGACTSETSEEINRPDSWMGEWNAEWETPPESYPDLVDMEFYMEGKFIFTKDSLTVINNGYPGCIFAVDTLKHTQSWKIANDTALVSYNDISTPGMTYVVRSVSEDRIRLQLMNDIFVTLTK